MRRELFLFLLATTMAFTFGCGGDDDAPTDAGVGDAGMTDTGPTGTDAGPDPDGGPDAGPEGCTTGCEIVELATGTSHTCARRANGTIRCWGNNEGGQAGDGRERHGLDCAPSGTTMPEDCTPPVDVSIIDDATQLTSHGGLSVCAIRSDESVWCWGLSGISPMEGSDLLPKRFEPEEMTGMGPATDLSDGWGHICAVSGGGVRCHGNNGRGELGTGDTTDRRVPTDVAGLTGVVDVEVSPMHAATTCVLNDASEIWCWGNDESFELGAGSAVRDTCTDGSGFDQRCSLTPVQTTVPSGVTPVQLTMGVRHGCFLSDTGSVYCWGENAFGQLGTGDTVLQNTPTEIVGLPTITSVKAGLRATCALDDTGQVWCWGGNEHGTIGDGMMSHGETCTSGSTRADCATSPQQVMGLADATILDLGFKHACAVRTSGEVWCWGLAERRQLSNGDDVNPQYAPVRAMGVE